MPEVLPDDEFKDVPYVLLDGVSPTIGWQFRPEKKGGPAFVIVRRSAFGMLKAVETFPLTENGWADAWQALLSHNPAVVPQARDALVRLRWARRVRHRIR
jgi:hypothetical protein